MVVAIRSFRSARRCRCAGGTTLCGMDSRRTSLSTSSARWIVHGFVMSGAREHLLQDRFPAEIRGKTVRMLHHGLLCFRIGLWSDRRPRTVKRIACRTDTFTKAMCKLRSCRCASEARPEAANSHRCMAASMYCRIRSDAVACGFLVNCRWQDDTAFCGMQERSVFLQWGR